MCIETICIRENKKFKKTLKYAHQIPQRKQLTQSPTASKFFIIINYIWLFNIVKTRNKTIIKLFCLFPFYLLNRVSKFVSFKNLKKYKNPNHQ